MDGVTLNTEPIYARAEISLFKEYGVTIPAENWSLFRGCSEIDFYKLSMDKYNIKEDFNIFLQKGRKYVEYEFSKGIPFMPGFIALQKKISPYFYMGLVTASPRHSLNKTIKKLNLNFYFDYIVSGEDATNNKPHPDPYILMMNKLNVLPKYVVIVEDSLVGLNAALASGAHVVAKTGSVPNEQLSHISYKINHLSEINKSLLKEILQKNI